MKVTVQLIGGLGNQMFQYAAGLALAKHLEASLSLDIDWFEKKEDRQFDLEAFALAPNWATDAEKAPFSKPNMSLAARAIRKAKPYYRRPVFQEAHYHYDENFWKAQAPVYLEGYWQSEHYFGKYATDVRTAFTFSEQVHSSVAPIAEQIKNTLAVSLHVRRGDYVANPNTNKVHGTCSPEYYKKAAALLREDFPTMELFVFSDDIEWAQQNLHFPSTTHFVDSREAPDYEDMRLMSMCQHHIIANSSFSWWGAWLNANPHKKVYAPTQWFANSPNDTKDLIPTSWLRL